MRQEGLCKVKFTGMTYSDIKGRLYSRGNHFISKIDRFISLQLFLSQLEVLWIKFACLIVKIPQQL